jgi:hypothetical protein
LVKHKRFEYIMGASFSSLRLPRLVTALPAEFKARKVPKATKSKERRNARS